jgi:hypothetical protein
MARHTVHVISEETRKRALTLIQERPAIPFDVTISDAKRDRSLAQKGLYFLWVGVIAAELGETKEAVHLRCKQQFFMPIYMRDDPYGYGSMMMSILDMHKLGLKQKAKSMVAQVVKLTSTNDASVEQFTEALGDIEKFYLTLGIVLPHPEDRFYEAMGIR